MVYIYLLLICLFPSVNKLVNVDKISIYNFLGAVNWWMNKLVYMLTSLFVELTGLGVLQ